MGPGKADLLEAIHQYGSISVAAKHMNMSYRRAWELVNTMNLCFVEPLVRTSPGGIHGGGAQLTELGFHVLTQFRNLVSKSQAAADHELAEIASHFKTLD